MSVAVIVPTFNRLELFKKAYQSVMDQTYPADWFLILNNNCTDGTREFLEVESARPHTSTKVIVHHSPENLGASGGMRFLFEEALKLKPDWIWVMDDDGLADAHALNELISSDQAQERDAYILESAIVDEKGEWSAANRPALFDAEKFSFEGLPAKVFSENKPVLVHTGPFCGMFIRRQTFEEFGFPRSEFYLWYDDVEFVLRVSRKKKVYIVPSSRIQHFAQALVPHEKKWPFSGPLPKIPEKLLWRYYYLNRNWLWMGKQFMPKKQYAVFFAKQMARQYAAPLLMKQDRLFWRWKVMTQSGLDALFNRLGKRL